MQLAIAHGTRQRHVEIVLGVDRRKLALRMEKVVRDGPLQCFYRQTGTSVLPAEILRRTP